MFTGKKSAQIREILISESAWEEMTCLFAPSLTEVGNNEYKDSRFVLCGLNGKTPSPYIHAAREVVRSNIGVQQIHTLAQALEFARENSECDCPECQHEKGKTTHKTANQATFH